VRSCGRCPGKHEIGRSGPKPDNTGCDGWISFPGVDKSISRNHAVSPAPAPCPCLPRLPTQGRWSRQCCSPDFRASARPIDGSLQSITVKPLVDPHVIDQVRPTCPGPCLQRMPRTSVCVYKRRRQSPVLSPARPPALQLGPLPSAY